MHWINWVIVVAYLTYVVVDGIRKSKDTDTIAGYFAANKSLSWWVVGLSVMATQLSAVTMIGTTGQGATDGLRFVQLYFGLPLAMVILGVTLVPLLHGSGVYTAYEYLEQRFDAKTRSFTAFLFLLSRGMSVGTIMAAPGVVLSAIFGIPLVWAVVLIGVPTVMYTMIGGVQAVAWADVKQMVLIVVALVAIMIVLLVQMPVHPHDALQIAGATGRLKTFDFGFDINEQYTFWSGVLGGTFLMLSYFGTDQSQVQRYLAARSIEEANTSLLVSAYWKIPLQALVLFVGVGVFVYYQFVQPPLLYNPAHEEAVVAERGAAYDALQAEYASAFTLRESAALEVAAAGDDATADAAMQIFLDREADIQTIRGTALTHGRGRDRRSVTRRQLHHPTLRAQRASPRVGRTVHRGGHRRCDVEHFFRAQFTRHNERDRLLSPMGQTRGDGRPLPCDFERSDGPVGPLCLRGRDIRSNPGLTDRGGEPIRIVLLRIDSRRLPARHDSEGASQRGVCRADPRHDSGRLRELPHGRRIPVAERDRRRGRGRRRSGAECRRSGSGLVLSLSPLNLLLPSIEPDVALCLDPVHGQRPGLPGMCQLEVGR